VAEVIGHRQIFEPAPIAQAVGYEDHAPHLIDRLGQLQRYPLIDGALGLLALTNYQIGFPVQAVHPFVIHTRKVPAQQVEHSAVAKPAPLMGNIHNAASQSLSLLTGHGWVAGTVSAQPHKSAGEAFGELKLFNHLADRLVHAGLCLPQETNDLFVAKSAPLHVRHPPW